MHLVKELPAWFVSLPGEIQAILLAISILVIVIVINAKKVNVLVSPHAIARARASNAEGDLLQSVKIIEKWAKPVIKTTFHLRGTYFRCIVVGEINFDDDLKKMKARAIANGEKGPFLGVATCFTNDAVGGHFTTSSRDYDD